MINNTYISIVIEQVALYYFLVMGLSFLIHEKRWVNIIGNIVKTEESLMSCGMMELLLGLLAVSFHNIWTSTHTVIVTLIAWGLVLEACLILIVPKFYKKVAKYFYNKPMITFLGILMIVISAIIYLKI